MIVGDSNQCSLCKAIISGDPSMLEAVPVGDTVVFFPAEPAVLGRCLVASKRHVETLADLNIREVQQMISVAYDVAKILTDCLHSEGVSIVQSSGPSLEQDIPHVHFHVIPWQNHNPIGEFPPSELICSKEEMDEVLVTVRRRIVLSSWTVSPEDRRQHLIFLQEVISRMSQSSAMVKGWLLPAVTAVYGYSLTKNSLPVALLGIFITIIFMIVDLGYLSAERRYRLLYARVADGDPSIAPYSLNYAVLDPKEKYRFSDRLNLLRSWFVWPLYTSLILVGIFVVVTVIVS